jgi:hypothetical protein
VFIMAGSRLPNDGPLTSFAALWPDRSARSSFPEREVETTGDRGFPVAHCDAVVLRGPRSASRFRKPNFLSITVSLCSLFAVAHSALGKEVEEKYPAGQTHLTYSVKNGLREGPFTELYDNGATKVTAFYKSDVLNGKYTAFFRNGKTQLAAAYRLGKLQGKLTEFNKLGHLVREASYRDGLLEGPEITYEDDLPIWQVTWVDGQAMKIDGLPIYPRSQDDIWHSLQAIARGDSSMRSVGRSSPSVAASATDDSERLVALRRLNAYRYVAELPADVGLDAEQSAAAESAAKLAAAGKSSDAPPDKSSDKPPGEAARKSTGNCSIFAGRGRMSDAIDAILSGSTDTTGDDFTDRRWCLNPAMRTIGLGRSDDTVALWNHDDRRKTGAEWQSALYPCRGFMPIEYFSADQSWMALINPSRVTLASKSFDVIVRPVDDQVHPGKPLKILDRHVASSPAGLPTALVFKPAGVEAVPGRHYWVELWGLKAAGGAPYPLQYLVDFITVHPEDGAVLALEGVPTYPRTLDDLRRGLDAVNNAVPAPFDVAAAGGKNAGPSAGPNGNAAGNAKTEPATNADAVAAVRRLNAYRFLCGLPSNVTLDPDQTFYAEAAAKLLKAVGKLDHTPANPGVPEQEYKDGYNGTSHSNIFMASNSPPIAASVDAYMDDSDASNIDRLGHRRWCLNPAMQTTGFGKYEQFSDMWSMDSRRPNSGDWDIVAYPARGFMPTEYFSAHHAWSLILNDRRLKAPDSDVDISIRPLADSLHPGSPLELDFKAVETGGYGGGPAIIFRPKSLDISSGHRYGVEIKGVSTTAGTPITIRYVVEFVDLSGRTTAAAKK